MTFWLYFGEQFVIHPDIWKLKEPQEIGRKLHLKISEIGTPVTK